MAVTLIICVLGVDMTLNWRFNLLVAHPFSPLPLLVSLRDPKKKKKNKEKKERKCSYLASNKLTSQFPFFFFFFFFLGQEEWEFGKGVKGKIEPMMRLLQGSVLTISP